MLLCVNSCIQMPWARFIVDSITLLSNRFPITPHSDLARFFKSCHFARICFWFCTLTKFVVSILFYEHFPYLSEALSMVIWSNQQIVADLCRLFELSALSWLLLSLGHFSFLIILLASCCCGFLSNASFTPALDPSPRTLSTRYLLVTEHD